MFVATKDHVKTALSCAVFCGGGLVLESLRVELPKSYSEYLSLFSFENPHLIFPCIAVSVVLGTTLPFLTGCD